ncbi:hypothetical protein QAD02_010047 [Eretmocerus hayati]|uniref:Uncharacterized protein n=1 Tax=Eretmocerus hayati TaxID=131215 RepID=A0ACC2NBE5_9HYME|nr:hypothetical protein QAD02_010047 [Eretmocerus hayati]
MDGTYDSRAETNPKMAEEIVISGMAGRFPESDNIEELHQNLLNKIHMVTNDDRRWKLDHPNTPRATGKINHLEKFDARFFGITTRARHFQDPMARMLLEHSFEALIDAGLNPRQLRGSKIGVYIGISISETESVLMSERYMDDMRAYAFFRCHFPNTISYCLGLTGPSCAIDTACSSSMSALETAYRAINDGQCEAALVGGANLCLLPHVNKWFNIVGTYFGLHFLEDGAERGKISLIVRIFNGMELNETARNISYGSHRGRYIL